MSVFLTASLLMVHFLLVVSKDQIITAEAGQNITLNCTSNDSRPAVAVEWDRPGLKPECVLLFRDDQIVTVYQHPSFKNRVDLQDRQMKNGDVSLVLNNVTNSDNGTYVCRVAQRGTNRKKRAVLESDPLRIIYLQVSPPEQTGDKERQSGGHQDGTSAGQTGDKDKQSGGHQDGTSAGQTGLIVGLLVSAVFVLMISTVIIIFIVKRRLSLSPPNETKNLALFHHEEDDKKLPLYHPPNEAEKPAALV